MILEIPSVCQTVWIQIRPKISLGLKVPNSLQWLSADSTRKLQVNTGLQIFGIRFDINYNVA